MKAIDLKHWTDGGTGVTNFEENEMPLYEKAIKRFGDTELVVSDKPIEAKVPYKILLKMKLCSFHNLKENHDLSDFWKVFKQVKSENENES